MFKNICFLWLAFLVCLHAQNTEVAQLNQQLGSFQLKFQHLMHTRGTHWYQSKKIDVQMLSTAINEYDKSKNTALLFYFFEANQLHHWVVDHTGIVVHTTTPLNEQKLQKYTNNIRNYYQQQNHRGAKVKSRTKNNKPPKELDILTKELFPSTTITALEKYFHWMVVPASEIAAIPIYTLQPFEDQNIFVVDKHVVNIAHSMDEFLNQVVYQNEESGIKWQRKVTLPLKNPLLIGNPDFSGCENQFSSLLGAEKEVTLIGDLWQTKTWIGKDATKNVLMEKSKNSNLIYLATHGISDSSDPMHASYLVMSTNQDGNCEKVTAMEAQNLKLLPETLVVLSACQTGLGQTLDAGIIGVGRAFIKAGASNVVMSLWDVNDQATQELMQVFAEQLLIPQSYFPSNSLRNAMLQYKQKNPNPSAWGAFISMGTPIVVESNFTLQR